VKNRVNSWFFILLQTFASAFLMVYGSSSFAQEIGLQQLDTRNDGSRILNISVLEQPRELSSFSFFDEYGNEHTMSNYRGKVVALHFWATWCPPCRKELPSIDYLQKVLDKEEFTFITLSVDREGINVVAEYMASHNINNLPIFLDENMKAARALFINGIPSTILIDREGREIGRILGDRDWSLLEVENLMRRIIR
jgi:thiol-disulfide isomerase/thioredoxin